MSQVSHSLLPPVLISSLPQLPRIHPQMTPISKWENRCGERPASCPSHTARKRGRQDWTQVGLTPAWCPSTFRVRKKKSYIDSLFQLRGLSKQNVLLGTSKRNLFFPLLRPSVKRKLHTCSLWPLQQPAKQLCYGAWRKHQTTFARSSREE